MAGIRKPEYAWFNKLISKNDYGRMVPGKISRPTKAKWMAWLNTSPGDRWKIIRSLTNRDLQAHVEGHETLYYTPATSDKGLLGIDIDCHKSGSAEGAKQARTFVEHWLPGVYSEVSTGGVGGHGYVVVEYGDWSAEEVKDIWINLCDALDKKCRSLDIDIEKIEAKGLPATIVAEQKKGATEDSKMGILIKMPRNIKAAMGTCVLTPWEIVRITEEINASVPETEVVAPAPASSNLICEREDINSLVGYARKLVYAYHPQVVLSNRVRVTPEDVAVALWIVRFTKQRQNKAGHTPGNRIRAIWNVLREQGITQRAFDPKRWAFIRNMLSDYGYIEWENAQYSPGKAMQWAITDELEAALDNLMTSSSTGEEQDFTPPPFIQGQRPINCWIITFDWTEHTAELDALGLWTLFIAA